MKLRFHPPNTHPTDKQQCLILLPGCVVCHGHFRTDNGEFPWGVVTRILRKKEACEIQYKADHEIVGWIPLDKIEIVKDIESRSARQ